MSNPFAHELDSICMQAFASVGLGESSGRWVSHRGTKSADLSNFMIDRNVAAERDDGTVVVADVVITVLNADLPCAPRSGDRIESGSERWRVIRPLERNESHTRLEVEPYA